MCFALWCFFKDNPLTFLFSLFFTNIFLRTVSIQCLWFSTFKEGFEGRGKERYFHIICIVTRERQSQVSARMPRP